MVVALPTLYDAVARWQEFALWHFRLMPNLYFSVIIVKFFIGVLHMHPPVPNTLTAALPLSRISIISPRAFFIGQSVTRTKFPTFSIFMTLLLACVVLF
jgi:hypothetical protein